MALVVYDRVQETTTTTGTGSVTLAGAVSGYQSFAVVGNTNTTFYCILNGSAWEVGIGTYSTTGPTLARTTVLSNSNGNTTPLTLVGASNVFCTYPSEKSVNLDASGNVSPLGTIASGTWQATTVATAYGGTGLTTFTAANYALYSTSASALTAGTLPAAAGGTGNTTGQAASVASALTLNNGGAGAASGTTFNGSTAVTLSYNTIGASPLAGSTSLTTLGTVTAGTWNASVIGATYGGTGVNNGANTLTLSGSYTLNQSVASGASPTFTGTNFSGTAASLTVGAVSSNVITRAMLYKASNDGTAVLCGADGAIFLNPKTITTSTVIPANYGANSVGPMIINSGVTVTVSSGAKWVIL